MPDAQTVLNKISEVKSLAIGLDRQIRSIKRSTAARDVPRGRDFVKHALVRLIAGENGDPAETHAARYKGTTSPMAMPDWADVLSVGTMIDFLLGSSSPSLFARLLTLGLDIGERPVRVPYRIPNSGGFAGDWVEENMPAPVERLHLASATPTLHKLVSLSTFSRDLRRHSNPQIERVLDTILRADINAIADSTLVDDQPESSRRPAGILNGLTATPAGSTLTDTLKALTGAVLAGGGTSVVYLINTASALDLTGLASPLPYPVLDSPYVPADIIIAIDPGGFIASLSSVAIDVNESAAVHLEDANPKPIVDGEYTLASPVASLWQTATVGMRTILDCGWTTVPGRVAFAQTS